MPESASFGDDVPLVLGMISPESASFGDDFSLVLGMFFDYFYWFKITQIKLLYRQMWGLMTYATATTNIKRKFRIFYTIDGTLL